VSLFKKLFGLGEAVAKKAEEAIDDRYGVEIHEANIARARKRLTGAKQKVDECEAKNRVQKRDLEAYESQVAGYEASLADIKQRHDNAKEAGDEQKATEFRALGLEVHNEIKSLKAKYAPQIEAYEFTLDTIKENRTLIVEMENEIQAEEQLIANYRANAELIKVHKAQTELAAEIKGVSVAGGAAVSKLARRQEEERELIRLQRERKNASSNSLQDKIDAATTDDDGLGW